MCVESVKVARGASQHNAITTASGATQKLFSGNSGRYSLSAYVRIANPLVDNVSGMFAAYVGGTYLPLIPFSNAAHGGHVSILEIGEIITEEIWLVSLGTNNPGLCFAVETYMDAELPEYKK